METLGRQVRAAFLIMVALATGLGPGQARADSVVVFAAASLGTVLGDLADRFENDTGHNVTLSLAGSSALARQIQAGAPADLFLSASTDWMEVVQAQGLVQEGTRVDLLGNSLILVGGAGAAPMTLTPATDLVAALNGGRLAMALVDAVPAGQYGRQALQALGLWDAVAPHVAQTDNVRAALTLVLRGEAPLGIVYASDITGVAGAERVAAFDPALHAPIIYPLALLSGARDDADRAFWAYLQTPDAARIFAAAGFQPLSPHD